MMASQKFNFLALVLFLATIASVLGYGVAQEDFCVTSQDKKLCKTMVGEAKNWHDAMKNAIRLTLFSAKDLHSKSDTIALQIPSEPKKDAIQKTCREYSKAASDLLKEALDALEASDNGMVQTKLNDAMKTECYDEFSAAAKTFVPLVGTAKQLMGSISVCLAVVAQNVKP